MEETTDPNVVAAEEERKEEIKDDLSDGLQAGATLEEKQGALKAAITLFNDWWAVAYSILSPGIGFMGYISTADTEPKKANRQLIAALTGVVLWVVILYYLSMKPKKN